MSLFQSYLCSRNVYRVVNGFDEHRQKKPKFGAIQETSVHRRNMAAEAKPRGDKVQNNRRRRKKRRTEDFSSDSDSSSSSDESMSESNTTKDVEKQDQIEQEVAETIDIDIGSLDQEQTAKFVPENLSAASKLKLAQVPLTTSSISNANSVGRVNPTNPQEVKSTIEKDRANLNSEYLKLFASEFNEDIDNLRKKPDFTEKSLVILAKALQSGSNIFDEETLNALLNK